MEAVPKEAYWIGMAGVVPYMATSLSTVYAAWELNNVFTTGSGALMNEKTAELMLQILEPIQIGYGAAVCMETQPQAVLNADHSYRSFPSPVPFTGDLSSPATAVTLDTSATTSVYSLPLPHRPPSSCRLRLRSSRSS